MRRLSLITAHWEFLLAGVAFVAAIYAAVFHIVTGALGLAGYFLMCALGLLWACSAFAEATAFALRNASHQRAQQRHRIHLDGGG